MIRKLLRKLGAVKSSLAITAFSILSSVLLFIILSAVLGRFSFVGVVKAITIPAIVAPLLSYFFLRVLAQLELAEEALRENENKYRNLVERANDGIAIIQENILKYVNPRLSELTGYTVNELTGTPFMDYIDPDAHLKVLDYHTRRMAGENVPSTYEAAIQHKDGSKIDVEFNASIITYEERPAAFAIVRDMTEHKQAEKELQESEEKYRLLFDNAADLIAIVDTSGDILDINEKIKEEGGYNREEIIGKNVFTSGLLTKLSATETLVYLKKLLEGVKGPVLKIEGLRKDGEIVPFELKAVPIKKDGEIVAIHAILRNIVERNQAEEEKEKLEVQLQQAQRMEAIGTLAGGIAHDFNNLLMTIQGNASLMLFGMDNVHPHYVILKRIEEQVRSGAKLTKQLLGYARKGKYEVKPVHLNQVVEEISEAFGRAKKEITIHLDSTENLCTIEADRGQIEQMLLNLSVNAADAMPGGGDLFLKTTNVTHDDMKGKVYDPKPGTYVLLTVTDTGTGMDKETQEHIFDPFFTTKEMGRGTGLGLASVYGIVKGHGGYIDVESERGRGTTFRIYLPASEKSIEKEHRSAEQTIEGNGTILLVDDEATVLDVGVRMLEHLGYTVLQAKGGREAVGIYEKKKEQIDMIILDMIMPQMGGRETYDRLKEINTDVRVLLSSGYSIDGQAKEILKRGCDGFLQKPFRMEELSGKLKEMLSKRDKSLTGITQGYLEGDAGPVIASPE